MKRSLVLIFLVVSLTACKPGTPPEPLATHLPSTTPTLVEPTQTPTPLPPTLTPVPMAALVNGEGIPLAEFQAELKRFQDSGTKLATDSTIDANQTVLEDLIDQLLLAQSAYSGGFTLDEAALQARIDQLATKVGGSQALEKWMSAHQYTPEEFRQSLKRSAAAAWMRDQIVSAVPSTAEQLHVRQILLYNSKQAEDILTLLQSGQDFAKLAKQYDPVTGGDLGWFPRGYLNVKVLEDAAFALQPGEYSQVIQTPQGFHLVQVIERDPQHPLSPEARLTLEEKALAEWVQQRREQSDIQILVP